MVSGRLLFLDVSISSRSNTKIEGPKSSMGHFENNTRTFEPTVLSHSEGARGESGLHRRAIVGWNEYRDGAQIHLWCMVSLK